ncbi:MAG: hypothetical protein GX335_07880 [Firmicutes bacterium]|nr:hypothetical protein [Bacillota bacterium]
MHLIKAVVEYNDRGFLVYADNYCGAYTRGRTKEEALGKLKGEVQSYLLWATGIGFPENDLAEISVIQEKFSSLQIHDADTEVIFRTEKLPLDHSEYTELKNLVIKSAEDFQELYTSIPDKNRTTLEERQTFYGPIPRTAYEMYEHTNKVTNYYLAEIGIKVPNLPNIAENRINVFKHIESTPRFLKNTCYKGSYGEQWSLKKVLRRFIWHDRIHAKAMYRVAANIWGQEEIRNPYFFEQ